MSIARRSIVRTTSLGYAYISPNGSSIRNQQPSPKSSTSPSTPTKSRHCNPTDSKQSAGHNTETNTAYVTRSPSAERSTNEHTPIPVCTRFLHPVGIRRSEEPRPQTSTAQTTLGSQFVSLPGTLPRTPAGIHLSRMSRCRSDRTKISRTA